MSKTHTGEVTKAAKRVSRWLVDRAKGSGRPTTNGELLARVEATCKAFNSDDQTAIIGAALVLFKRDDPIGYGRVIANAMHTAVFESQR